MPLVKNIKQIPKFLKISVLYKYICIDIYRFLLELSVHLNM